MLRNVSLRYRLILVVIPLIAVFMTFNYYKIVAHEQEMLIEETRLRATAIVRVLGASTEQAIRSINTHDLELAVQQVMSLEDVKDVVIVNKNGGIEASHDPMQLQRISTDPLITQVLRGGPKDEPMVSTDEKSGMLEVVAPVTINNEVQGAVSLKMDLSKLHEAIGKSRTYVLELTGMLLVGAILFMLAVAQWFTGPILRLALVARAIAAGDVERRAEVRGGDEIGVLGEAFNEMSLRLRGMMENEKRAREDLQRRVAELLERTERVASGDLEGPEAPESPDEMGRLAAGFNDMVRNIRHYTKIQQATLYELEESSSALAEANRQLKELDRLKSEFLNTVSHELRTPLTSIKAFSEILLDSQGDDPETLREFLGIINQESDRLTRLINNLLDLSRIEAGRMQWDMEPIDLRDVGEACQATGRALADKRGVRLVVDVPDNITVVGDRDKLIQVVTNLMSNGIKFTPAGGRVKLTAEKKGENVEIRVSDNGIGIASEFHDKVFEKFQQVDTSSTREVKGSGLGLPIVRSIVEAHGGSVHLESEPGKGSTFIVTLPAPEVDEDYVPVVSEGKREEPASGLRPVPAVVTAEEAAATVRGRRAQNILVVDDEMNIIRVMRHILEAEGYTVLEAQSGEEALRRARVDRPDLILLDVLLPDIDGFEVLERLRSDPALSDIPVVILSILEAKEESFRLGAQDYCTKPIDRARLLETVQGLLGDVSQEVRILVVDDDPNILTALSQMLGSRGYKVIGAKDGLEALVRARDDIPSLIVLDLYMPEMDGFEVIRRLRGWEETAHIPILVLTASDVALDEARAMHLGAARYMSKPFSEQQLSEVVHEALTRVMSNDGPTRMRSAPPDAASQEVCPKTEV